MTRFVCWVWLVTLFVPPVAADEIILVADEWCPYNCTPGAEKPGYLVEAATSALMQAGHTVVYLTIPWNRAISAVREGRYHGLIGTGRRETPDFIFPTAPLAKARHSFYTDPENTWSYNGYDSLKDIRIAVIKDYSYGDLYEDYVVPNEKNAERVTVLYGENAISRLIAMLERGWVDAFIEDQAVFEHYLKLTENEDCFRQAGMVVEEDIYIAFSPALENARKYANDLASGLRELERSGKLESLQASYFTATGKPQTCD